MALPDKKFYLQDTLTVAQELLGMVLCRRVGDKILRGVICETEAYTQDEPSCHAYRGLTDRCEVMFRDGGFCYVYFIYGMHYCMNVVTEKAGRGCAVLVRALEPLDGLTGTNGPSRLCKVFGITKELNGVDLRSPLSPLWIEKGDKPPEIVTSPRVGITAAVDYPWRFYIKDSKWVSKK